MNISDAVLPGSTPVSDQLVQIGDLCTALINLINYKLRYDEVRVQTKQQMLLNADLVNYSRFMSFAKV